MFNKVVKSNQILNNRQNIDIILLHSNTCLVTGIFEMPFNKINNDKIKTLTFSCSSRLNIKKVKLIKNISQISKTDSSCPGFCYQHPSLFLLHRSTGFVRDCIFEL